MMGKEVSSLAVARTLQSDIYVIHLAPKVIEHDFAEMLRAHCSDSEPIDDQVTC